MSNRREFVIQLAGMLVTSGAAGGLMAARLPSGAVRPLPITIYKSSTCGCCAKWVDYLRTNGFATTVRDENDMDRVKGRLGVPQAVRSCHTAVVAKYLVEGHVPAADIRRMVAEQPRVMGLAVPGMPPGTPGMAASENEVGDFEVVSFQKGGETRTFAQY
jgi:hypothetical protein